MDAQVGEATIKVHENTRRMQVKDYNEVHEAK